MFAALVESQTKTLMMVNSKKGYVYRTLDKAYQPKQRVSPRRTLIVVAISGIGGLITVLFVLITYFLERIYFLPILVIFRFASNFVEKANILSLQLQVEKNLRVYLIKEVYKKGNYSVADATFYINTLSGHVGYFYAALTSFLNIFFINLYPVSFDPNPSPCPKKNFLLLNTKSSGLK